MVCWGRVTSTPASASISAMRSATQTGSRNFPTASRVIFFARARLAAWVSDDQSIWPCSRRPPAWTSSMAWRVRVIPLLQICTVSCGMSRNLPCPVSELVSTNPANTVGLSAPRAPENGEV